MPVFPWPTKSDPIHTPAHKIGPQVSLTTEVEARFVNTLITRTGEPDLVPLTTNLGLKNNRRTSYFQMEIEVGIKFSMKFSR